MGIQKGKCMATAVVEQRQAECSRKPLDSSDEQSIDGKVVVITGANSGVGEAAALEFAKRGATVVMPCRNLAKAQTSIDALKAQVPNAQLDLFQLDLGDFASVRKCAQEIRVKYPKIDILVNNAGFTSYKDMEYTKEGFEIHMAVNHLGPHLFTELLLDNVKAAAPSRIIFVTSMGFQLGELDPEDFMLKKRGGFLPSNFGPYCNSKLATQYCVKIMAEKLEGSGVNVYALCPGYVNSGFQEKAGFFAKIMTNALAITPAKGAENILYCALMNATGNESGLMYRTNGIWKGAMESLDEDIGDQVWNKTNEYLQLV